MGAVGGGDGSRHVSDHTHSGGDGAQHVHVDRDDRVGAAEAEVRDHCIGADSAVF